MNSNSEIIRASNNLSEAVHNIKSRFRELISISGVHQADVSEVISITKELILEFENIDHIGDYERTLSVAITILHSGIKLTDILSNEVGSSKIISSKLDKFSDTLKVGQQRIKEAEIIYKANRGDFVRTVDDKDAKQEADWKEIYKLFADEKKFFDEHIDDQKSKLDKNYDKLETQLKEALTKISGLQDKYNSTIDHVDNLYADTKKNLKSKEDALDKHIGTLSSRVIADNFENSADQERKSANYLRIGAIACMVLIAGVILYSLWETTTEDFNWQESLFRLIFSIVLSVPAAYLARESAKHRQQQYHYHQTSLDLKAITPYIASLPEEEQHRLKSEIAQRLFAPKDFGQPASDPYPINTHEVLMALLNKFDFKQPESKPESKTTAQ